jgi:hypothetical protein
MIKVKFKTTDFMKEMDSIVQYANGFMDGAQAGKKQLLETIGAKTKEILESFIDSNARTNQAVLHHVYEWQQSGNAASRLFDIEYTTSGGGLTLRSTFRQSVSVKNGSTTPFYDKARIIEEGIPVRIKAKVSSVLSFSDGGEQVFTKLPIDVSNPGGSEANGGFQRIVDSFFNSYWKQSFLKTSGIADILRNPIQFKQNLPRAKAGGRSVGYDVGYRWIAAREAR